MDLTWADYFIIASSAAVCGGSLISILFLLMDLRRESVATLNEAKEQSYQLRRSLHMVNHLITRLEYEREVEEFKKARAADTSKRTLT